MDKCEMCNWNEAQAQIQIPTALIYPHIAAQNTHIINRQYVSFSGKTEPVNVCAICLNRIMLPVWEQVKSIREEHAISSMNGSNLEHTITGLSDEEVREKGKRLSDYIWEPESEPRPWIFGLWKQTFKRIR